MSENSDFNEEARNLFRRFIIFACKYLKPNTDNEPVFCLGLEDFVPHSDLQEQAIRNQWGDLFNSCDHTLDLPTARDRGAVSKESIFHNMLTITGRGLDATLRAFEADPELCARLIHLVVLEFQQAGGRDRSEVKTKLANFVRQNNLELGNGHPTRPVHESTT